MKNKIISIVLLLASLTGILSIGVSAEDYWSAQAAYNAAIESGDEDAILDAVKQICAVYPEPSDTTEYTRVMFPIKKAAEIYEKRGQFDLAAENYKLFLEGAEFMCENGTDYSDYLKTVGMLYRHNSIKPTVYAETSEKSNLLYYGAKAEAEVGVYHGMCNYLDPQLDNAQLLYVQFFNESIEGFSWQLPKDVEDYLLVIGWNVPNENLEDLIRISSGEADEYIRENLEYLSTLGCKVLIRFGAEVNCWSSLPSNKADYEAYGQEFVDTFKSAFRRVSTMADTYAPNAGMIYSPNDISNWYFTPEDFYPGDEYVDWVGMSAYCNKTPTDTWSVSNANDAFYCRGDYYENELTKIAPIVEAFGDRKPIIITEGGFSYYSTDGVQTQEHAEAAMSHFYTYVSRVYPQIKCVMYFNAGPGSTDYKLFDELGVSVNPQLENLYRSLNSANVAMEYSMGRGDKLGYTPLGNIDEITDTLNLSVYASYPTTEAINVSYELDGRQELFSEQYPYEYSIDTSELGVGGHLLKVTTSCMLTTDVQYFKLTVSEDGRITVSEPIPSEFTDVPSDFWGYEYIAYGMATGLFAGKSETTFEPNESMTRAMFVTVLARLHGIDESKYTVSGFTDVGEGVWYTPYIAWAAENGIVNGVSDTEFAPMNIITREQMCAILIRYCDKFGVKIDSDEPAVHEPFADDGDISLYAVESVYRAKNAGIVTGKGGNLFKPAASATRAECATIFMRLCANFFS